MKHKTRRVREPIQVYLTGAERATLERLAGELGVSRAETLRRGLDALASRQGQSFYEAFSPLIGSIDNPDIPTDLADNHDEYLARDIEEQNARFPHERSS